MRPFCFALLIMLPQAAWAAAPPARPVARNIAFRSLWKAGAPLEIPVAPVVSSKAVSVPALPAARGRVLRFQARLHSDQTAGWNNFLGIRWRGKPLADVTAAGRPRLLNRARSFRSTIASEAVVPTVAERSGLAALCTFFGPDFNTLDPRAVTERGEGYWYLLDVSDLDMATPGDLEFVNTALAQYWNGSPPADLRMIIAAIAIGQAPAAALESLQKVGLARRKTVEGPTLAVGGAEVTLAPGGGLQIRRGGEITWAESDYLAPGEREGKTPRLAAVAPRPAGASGWARAGAGWQLRCTGRGFRLLRSVAVAKHRVVVSDTVVSEAARDLGVRVRHQLLTPGYLKRFRFAGVEGQRTGRPFAWADNPTLYVAQARSGVGLLAEDDFFRLHMEGNADANILSASDGHFGLAPGTRYTFRFALYPTAGDFWEFINAARRDWKVNFAVDGPFEFTGASNYQRPEDAEALRERLRRKDVRIFALSPWFEYYSGYGVTREAYKKMMQNAIRIIHSVKPDAICIPLTETNLVPVPLTFFQGKLPESFGWNRGTGGEYGKEAPPEAAAVLDASPWKDSVVRGEHGRPNLDTWYVQYYQEPKGLNLIVYPTLSNHRHRHMLEQLAWLLDDVGFDGAYIDQFAMALGGRDSLTYDVWDGHTVDLDPKTGQVTRKYAVVGKISAPARREWVEFIRKRGKLVVANGEPVVGEMQALATNRFMETQGYDVMSPGAPNATMCARGMLASPIGLGHSFGELAGTYRGRAGEVLMRTVIAHLRYGLLYYYYSAAVPEGEGGYGPINHMFPFTPVELHEGYVVGKERILTCRSRTFTWPGDAPPRVLLFDKRGLEKPAGARITGSAGAYRVAVKLDDWAEVAVIE